MKKYTMGLMFMMATMVLPAYADWSCTMQGTSYTAFGPSSDSASNTVSDMCKSNGDSCFKSIICKPVIQNSSSSTFGEAPSRGGYAPSRRTRRSEVISATIRKMIPASDCNSDEIADFDLNQNPGYSNAALYKIKLANLLNQNCDRAQLNCDVNSMKVNAQFMPSTGGALVTSLGTCTITGSVRGE
jgi:hypothetical protein